MSVVKEKTKVQKSSKADRKDVTENRLIILESFDKLYDRDNKMPTLKQISDDTGISIHTVHKYCKDLTLDFHKPHFKIASRRVLRRLQKNIEENGKAPEVKLFMQLVEDYREENKTVVTFDKEEAMKRIENIFLK